MRAEISDEEIKALATAIMTRHGVDFTCYEPKSLRRRIIRALSVFKMESIHQLWTNILRDNDFVHEFVNQLSVGLTAMFRDPAFWIRLSKELPILTQTNKNIKIWHAGCSTGEEVYTLNIIARELGLEGQIDSHATDMNTDALDQAEKGLYHTLKLTEYEHNYKKYKTHKSLKNYYTVNEKFGKMDPMLIRHVKFFKNNLISDTNPNKYDIIFCRNVMIYFDALAKKLVLDKLYDNLNEGGLLIIGYFDALVPILDKDKFEHFDLDHKIFRKKAESWIKQPNAS